jgi:hypothetical protein
MPFLDVARQPDLLQNVAPPDEPPIDPSLVETFGAAFRTQNVVGSWLSSRGMPDPYQIDEGFNSIDYVKDDPKFSPYVTEFAGIFNKRAADAKKQQILQEQADRRTLDAAGGLGTVAELAAGVFDAPTLLVPGGIALGSARGASSVAGRAALSAGVEATASELALQGTQATRTPEETALNVGGSVILGGALGALVGKYLTPPDIAPIARKIEAQEPGFEEFDKAFSATGAASAGAAVADKGPLTLKDEAIISRLPIVNRQDPLIRLQLSDYDAARQTIRGLAETPLEYADNAKGVATELGGSVETRMKLWSAPEAQTLSAIDTAFAKYFNSAPEPSSWQVRLSPLRSEFASRTGGEKLTYKQFKEEVGRAAFSGEQHAIPEVAEAAAAYRQVDDAMKKAAIEAKLFPEDVAVKGDISHLFRMYNQQRIIAERNRFADILQAHFVAKRDAAAAISKVKGAVEKADAAAQKADDFGRMSDAEVREVVDETINTILGNADGRIPYSGIVSGPRGPLRERVLNIESAKIADFLNLDIEEVLRSQVRTMSADVELSRKFGSVDMAEQIRQINDEADTKVNSAATNAERVKLEQQRKNAIRDVEAVRDRLRGQYALPSNPDGIVLRANRVIRNLNYLRLLGGMTISALPDLGRVITTHGLGSTFKDGFIPLITNFKATRLAAEEVKQAGTALDMILDTRAMALADIGNEFGRHSAFERGISALSSKFGIVSLMAPWNASLKQFSGLVVMTNLLRSAQRVADGTATAKEIRQLAASNIDADLAKRIAKQFSQHGQDQDGVLLARAADWSDNQAREAFRGAVVRDVDKIIVTPGQDKPLWMSTELGKTVGQFKSFSISAMQRIVLSSLQQRDAAVLNGAIVSLGLGALSYGLSQKIAGRDLSDDPGVWAVNAFDRSGLAGWMMEANNIAEKATRGRVGLSALTGQQVSRYASRNVTSAFLGPTPGTIADIFQVSGSIFAGDTSRADLNRARQMIPFQNLFYLRGLFNKVEEAAGNSLDLPEKKN